MTTVTVAGAIASAHGITLYLTTGKEMNLPNDSWKTQAILDKVLPVVARRQTVELELDEFSMENKIEEKTNGVISFIRATMEQLGQMIADLQGGKPIVKTAANSVDVSGNGDLAAIVKDDKGKQTIIPGAEKLRRQIDHAATTGNVKGLTAFMKRLAGIKTQHTVQELLTFMEKGDLPIADDGCIVAYKVLRSTYKYDDKKVGEGIFVDCHTGKVKQKLGSRVAMPVEKVDHSRRTQCSNGLHIARRGYLGNFSGDVITIVKIRPEDVAAVPEREPDKMRVAAYHIVAVLPQEVHGTLRSNQGMTGNEQAAQILADVIAGNHIGVTQEVTINGPHGDNVKYWDTGLKAAPKAGVSGKAAAIEESVGDKKIDPITPKAVRAAAEAAKKAAAESTETKAQRDARKKREKRAAEKAAREADRRAYQAPAKKQAAAKPTRVDTVKGKLAPAETKSERDARIKREKRAAAKAALTDPMRVIPGETKSQRDARIKRERYALKKAG